MLYKLTIIFVAVFVCYFASGPVVAQKATSDKRALADLSESFEELVTRISPAVVKVIASGYAAGATTESLISRRQSGGSGVILHSDGYIVTNAHVVEGANRVQVVLTTTANKGGSSILKPEGKRVGAQIVGVDRETDLAVLKVQEKNLPFLELSDSDDLRQGQIVLAFGSPFGLDNSVSMGVVSSVSRQLHPEDPMVYIQTDATINPGNSGGPLLDTDGRVVGINTLILSHAGGSEGVGFAAPSNIVNDVFNQFRTTGRVRRGHIGVYAQTIIPTMAEALALSQSWGVIIADVYPGSPAEKAGVQRGDIVITLDGKTMENGRQFNVNLYRRAVGDDVVLEIKRGGQVVNARVEVFERPDDPTRFSSLVNPRNNLIPKLGILCVDLDKQVARMLPALREPSGVVVAARAADAPQQSGVLAPGDVIHAINRITIDNVSMLRASVEKLNTGDAVVCLIERGGQFQYVTLEIDF